MKTIKLIGLTFAFLLGSFTHGTDREHSQLERGRKNLTSLHFQGSDLNGKPCQIFISGYGDHQEFRVLTKIDYRIHGIPLNDLQPQFYRYNIETNSYLDPAAELGLPALAAIQLKDPNQVPNLDLIEAYKKSSALVQLMRLDLFDVDVASFEAGLQNVIEGRTDLASAKTLLDQLNQAVLVVFHEHSRGLNYDNGYCTDFRLQNQMQQVEFQLGEKHEDGHDHADEDSDREDGDHDHDHEHEHGHSDENKYDHD